MFLLVPQEESSNVECADFNHLTCCTSQDVVLKLCMPFQIQIGLWDVAEAVWGVL